MLKFLIGIVVAASLPLLCLSSDFPRATHSHRENCEMYNYTICPCGTDGGKVTVQLDMCLWQDPKTGEKSCQPCNNELLDKYFCEKFENCKTCMSGLQRCLSCPRGRYGPFCNKDKLANLHLNLDLEGQFTSFPVGVRIPRGAPIKQNRLLRAMDSCDYPSSLDTAEVDCKIWPSSITCQEICVFGYTLPEGITKEITCQFDENKWSPTDFEECKPFVDCTVKLKSAGDLYCVGNKMDSGPTCEISCNEHEDIPEVPSSSYECDVNGNFSPPLPFCAEKGGDVQLVAPPKQKLHK